MEPFLVCSTDVMRSVLENQAAVAAVSIRVRDRVRDSENVMIIPSHVLLPFKMNDVWCLIYLNNKLKEAYYVDPRLNCNFPYDRDKVIETSCQIINPAIVELTKLLANGVPYRFSLFPKYEEGVTYYEPIENSADSGIFVLSIIDFLLYDVPIIIDYNYLQKLHHLLCYALLSGKFYR